MSELYYTKVTNLYSTAKKFSMQTSLRPPKTIKTSMITVTKKGVLSLRKKYAWNGVTKFPEVRYMRLATVVHDPWYHLIDIGLLPESSREEADMAFKSIALGSIDNMFKLKQMGRIRRWFARRTVKIAYKVLRKTDGKFAVKPAEVLIAP